MRLIVFTLLCVILVIQELPAQQATELTGFQPDRVALQLQAEQRLTGLNTPEAFRNHLYTITREPHVAGTPENQRLIDYLAEATAQAGLDVTRYEYDVWLAEPGEVHISVVSPVEIRLSNTERAYPQDPTSGHPSLTHGWNAYSGSGNVTAEIVYVNYGRREDFARLAEMGIDVSGKIVLARYGGNFRGYKAKFAEAAGAVGLIMYTDPANGGYVNGPVIPDGIFNNETAVQRGSLLTLDYYGDPLTPFEPALPMDGDTPVQRLHPSEAGLHTIPVAPLGYGAAQEIISRMQGEIVPEEWQGGLPFTYRITGGPELLVNLVVDQPQGIKRITNVVGMIEGRSRPDEWIILGSHFDAWGFGATDPNSGTAMLLTLTDALGEMVKSGYRPERSILIAHWDAEEFMLIGSTEWAEDLRELLGVNAVAYINADMSVTGPNFGASASPSLKSPIIEASRAVFHPDTGTSLYETWHRNQEQPEPPMGNLGGGSDHVPFYMHLGIPAAGISISGGVPIYHTNYDSFWFYETFIDSTFRYGPALAGVYGVLALRLANADLIPYDLRRYGDDLYRHLTQMSIHTRELHHPVNFEELFGMIEALQQAGSKADAAMSEALRDGRLSQAEFNLINTQLMQLERTFLHDDGLPFSAWLQSLYAAVNPFNGYESWMLPGLRYVADEHDGESGMMTAEKQRLGEAILSLTQQIEAIAALASGR
jgi:N-acetylated-alpha-linked acidic dipeptidase